MTASGTVAVIPVISQPLGAHGVARKIMPPMQGTTKAYIIQKFLKILGTSLKKLDFSASFAVAPHSMFMENLHAIETSQYTGKGKMLKRLGDGKR